MDYRLTRRHTLAILAGLAGPAFAEEASKKDFMRESLAAVKKNGQKLEPTTKMSFGAIPRVTPFVDWDYYYLEGPLLWTPNPGMDFEFVTVPKGFVTDLASVPSVAWSVFPRTGRYAYAAIVHDYLYWFQPRPRAEADKIMLAAMQDAAVPRATRIAFQTALAAAGGLAWSNNATARAAGEMRVLTKFPDDPLISWEDWRKRPGVFDKP